MNHDNLIYDVIIIGGGPAGLTAGLYTGRARLKTLLIESCTVPCQAVVTDSIENYPGFPEGVGGFELIEKFKKQTERFGVEFVTGDVRNILPHEGEDTNTWQVEVGDKTYLCLAVIVAAGAAIPKGLGIAGETKFRGRGVSYCATCDAGFFKDKDIVVVGGGDTAVEEALFLTKFGRKVTLIHRRDRLRAARILQERALANEKIDIIWNSQVIEILGRQAGSARQAGLAQEKVEAVKLKNIKTREESNIPCDGVFIFVGLIPNTDFLKEIIELDKAGYIITDDNMKTSREGIFACGDCRKKLLRQVVTACGDGAVAAFSAQGYIEELKGIASYSSAEVPG